MPLADLGYEGGVVSPLVLHVQQRAKGLHSHSVGDDDISVHALNVCRLRGDALHQTLRRREQVSIHTVDHTGHK